MQILQQLFQILRFIFWDNLIYTIIVLVFGWILYAAWNRANKRAEEGLTGLWHWVFSWLYFVLEVVTVVVLVMVVLRGSVRLYSFVRDQAHLGANEAAAAGGVEVTSTPGPLTVLGGTPLPEVIVVVPTSTPLLFMPTVAPTQTVGTRYIVSDPTGANVRLPGADGICGDGDTPSGILPFGTVVTITQTWISGVSVNGTSLRGLTSDGKCVHLGALAPQ